MSHSLHHTDAADTAKLLQELDRDSKSRSLLLLRLRARFTRNTRSFTVILTVSPHIGNHVSKFSPHLTNRVYKFRHNPFI